MSGTPIDQTLCEAQERFEAVLWRSLADAQVTAPEAVALDEAAAALRRVTTEAAATIRLCRSALHAGISSAWLERKAREHVRDTAALGVQEVIVAQMQ